MSAPYSREELERFLDGLLEPGTFPDYGPNGLQVEGAGEIRKTAFAVSATRASAEAAVGEGAQALVVHHGLFWRFHGPRPLTGPFARRVVPLVRGGVNLFAYHLPLDAHPVVGNAAGIARRLGMGDLEPFGDHEGRPTGVKGRLSGGPRPGELQERLEGILEHPVLLATPDPSAVLETMGIITGGANSDWARAAREGLCAYLTGEMSEHDWHESQEAGVHMFAGGHNATERFGVLQLKEAVEREFPGMETVFIPSENPA